MNIKPFILMTALVLCLETSCHVLHKPHVERVVVAYPVTQQHPWNLDPSTASSEIDLKAISYTQAGLMQLTPHLDVGPHLVLSPTFTPNGKAVIFTIKPGMRWSDDIPLSAQHVKDGIIRSLSQKPLSASAQAFQQFLPHFCVSTQKWDECIIANDQTLRIEFNCAADLALPYFTQPFTFPQRQDILAARSEKPYVTPSAYPSIGQYRITRHNPFLLDLDPIPSSQLKPLRLLQINTSPNFQELLSKGEIHILESPPLSFVETSPWASSLQAYTDFNMVLLLQANDATHPSITHVSRSDTIRKYITEKGLPVAQDPSPLQPFVRSCNDLLPSTVLRPEDKPMPLQITLYGPKHIFTFLAAESIREQVLFSYQTKLGYSALDMPSLTYFQTQNKKPYTLYIFRERVPSVLPFLKLFLSDNPSRLTDINSTYYNFLYQSFLQALPKDRTKIQEDIAHVLCRDIHGMAPLISVPVYSVVSPRIVGYKREGNGVYQVWSIK